MFLSSSRDKFTLLWQNSVTDFLLVSGRHVGAHLDGHQHGVSIQISINLRKTFLRVSHLRKVAATWILAGDFAHLPSFIFQFLDFIYWTVLTFILIYFEWRDTENQQISQHIIVILITEKHSAGYTKPYRYESYLRILKADFQSVLCTIESLFTTFVLFHVRLHKM